MEKPPTGILKRELQRLKKKRLFLEVAEFDQALVQKIVATVEEAYLSDIRNHTTNSTNNIVVVVLTCLQ